ncbi:hypothetical protein ACNIU6_26645, partial [Escherichia coli]
RLAMTRLLGATPQLNALENTMSAMLKAPAHVDLTANQ